LLLWATMFELALDLFQNYYEMRHSTAYRLKATAHSY
jgi:hypothetical protein